MARPVRPAATCHALYAYRFRACSQPCIAASAASSCSRHHRAEGDALRLVPQPLRPVGSRPRGGYDRTTLCPMNPRTSTCAPTTRPTPPASRMGTTQPRSSPAHLTADVTRPGDSDPAGAMRAAHDPIRENVATLGLHDASTIDHPTVGLTDSSAGTLVPAGPWPVAATRTVPGYDLLELLGEGGMGQVWKARQVKLNRLVAVKMVEGDRRAGSKELIRFLAEAEAVAAVKHPHVVQVYEYGDANGQPFLAMEYLLGGSLADRLERTGRLEPKVAAELVATLAGAVQAAHDLGIVHRDLKPGNVLYDDHGRPKVTDFGLAKRAGGSNLTATQAVMGTPAYMAPEQARGETKFVGPQADVYSLGVILYECLTRTKPFAGPDQIALLRKVAEDEPERQGSGCQGCPGM